MIHLFRTRASCSIELLYSIVFLHCNFILIFWIRWKLHIFPLSTSNSQIYSNLQLFDIIKQLIWFICSFFIEIKHLSADFLYFSEIRYVIVLVWHLVLLNFSCLCQDCKWIAGLFDIRTQLIYISYSMLIPLCSFHVAASI